MNIKEVFPNPTVKQVIFQIKFPNLFSLENKIGDLQLKIMKEFPESSLLFRRQIFFTDLGPKGKLEDLPKGLNEENGNKIWQFKSNKDFQLNILNNSLDITSQHHKTYQLEGGDKFRDIIKFVLDCFFDVMPIQVINRIGLRYIDECPIPTKENATFEKYYKSVFPISRFNLAEAREMDFKTIVKRGKHYLRYIESLQKKKDGYKLILDFDGFAEKISIKDYLKVLDNLHEIIAKEYEKTIKEPVYIYMRKSKRRGK